MAVLPMRPRKPAYRSTQPPEDLTLPPLPAPNAAGAAGLADEIVETIQIAMVGVDATLTPIDAIAAQVYALSITIAASAPLDAEVADTLARSSAALRLGVERCRRTIAADVDAWPPME